MINLLLFLSIIQGCVSTTSSHENEEYQCDEIEIERQLFLTVIDSKELMQLVENDNKDQIIVLENDFFSEVGNEAGDLKFTITDSLTFNSLVDTEAINLLKFREVKRGDKTAYVEYEYIDEGIVGHYDLELKNFKWQITKVDLSEE